MGSENVRSMACKLGDPKLQQRKAGVIAGLKQQVQEKKELSNGFAYKFAGSDDLLDQLTSFIKSERQCCDFFTFTLTVDGDQNATWLEMTGGEGVKDFIVAELDL